MNVLNKSKYLLFFIFIFGTLCCLYAQETDELDPTRGLSGVVRVRSIQYLYTQGDYTECLQLINETLYLYEEKELELAFFNHAKILVFKALVVYAYRKEDYQDQIKKLLLEAVTLDINFEFDDYSIIPTYIIDTFVKIKREYLDQYAKTTRRHTLGVYGSLTALPTFLDSPEYLKPGVHYSFNMSESFMFLVDVEFPATANIFNTIMGRTGVIWFPSFKIETVSMGLGALYAIRIERDANILHIVSIEGYGELILRFGLGIAASIELVRFDLSVGPYSSNFSNGGSVSFIKTDNMQLSFASLRLYLFWTF